MSESPRIIHGGNVRIGMEVVTCVACNEKHRSV